MEPFQARTPSFFREGRFEPWHRTCSGDQNRASSFHLETGHARVEVCRYTWAIEQLCKNLIIYAAPPHPYPFREEVECDCSSSWPPCLRSASLRGISMRFRTSLGGLCRHTSMS